MTQRAQMDLFNGRGARKTRSYPDVPGAKAQETSFAAADAIAEKAVTLKARVLEAIRMSPSTPEQVALLLGVPLMNVRPRCSELVAAKLIEDSGIRRTAMGGGDAIVWKAVRHDAD